VSRAWLCVLLTLPALAHGETPEQLLARIPPPPSTLQAAMKLCGGEDERYGNLEDAMADSKRNLERDLQREAKFASAGAGSFEVRDAVEYTERLKKALAKASALHQRAMAPHKKALEIAVQDLANEQEAKAEHCADDVCQERIERAMLKKKAVIAARYLTEANKAWAAFAANVRKLLADSAPKSKAWLSSTTPVVSMYGRTLEESRYAAVDNLLRASESHCVRIIDTEGQSSEGSSDY
jgi:hypothetical protein